ncbi:MAG: outer membrane beta-barrel protein [Spirochaetota bacterium]
MMKRIILGLVLFLSFLAAAPLAAAEQSFDGKLGGGYAFSDPDKAGLDISANYQWVLDPFFSAGVETGLFWIKWEADRGKELVGQSSANIKATTNAYSIPVIGIVQIRLPNLKDKIHVLPYLTVGLGYSLMPVAFSDPGYTDSDGVYHKSNESFDIFHGFTWKIMAGAAFTPAGSRVTFLGETGILGAQMTHGNSEIDMTRFLLNAGVRFTFGQ